MTTVSQLAMQVAALQKQVDSISVALKKLTDKSPSESEKESIYTKIQEICEKFTYATPTVELIASTKNELLNAFPDYTFDIKPKGNTLDITALPRENINE